MLNLAEDLFLLALDEEKGIVSTSGILQYALVGAILADLALADKISLEDNKVVVLDATSLDDAMLNAALATLAESTRNRSLTYRHRPVHLI